MFANVGPMTHPEGAIGIAQAAEDAGIESLWTVEHVLVPVGYESAYPYSPKGRMPGPEDSDIPDPLIWLAYVAAATSTIRLATGILILPERNPIVLAKELATLDRLSGGRMELGVGVGWLKEEFEALGIPWETRGARTDDNIKVLRTLWGEGAASYSSEFTSFGDAYSRPRPTQPTIPIVIGGHSKPAARRAGRLGDGFFPGRGSKEDLTELIAVMRATAVEHGRDPDAIEITSGGDGALGPGAIDEVKKLADLGVSRVIIPPLAFDVAGQREAFAALRGRGHRQGLKRAGDAWQCNGMPRPAWTRTTAALTLLAAAVLLHPTTASAGAAHGTGLTGTREWQLPGRPSPQRSCYEHEHRAREQRPTRSCRTS